MLQWIVVLFDNSVFLNDIHIEYFAYLQCKSVKQEYHYGICSFRTEMQSAVFHVVVFFHSHQQQLIIGNQTLRPPCSSPHQWYMTITITKHKTFKYIKKTQKKQFELNTCFCFCVFMCFFSVSSLCIYLKTQKKTLK